MPHFPFDAVIFDLDGTLIDTEHADFAAWQLLFTEADATLSPKYWAEEIVGVMNSYNLLYNILIEHSRGRLTRDYLTQRITQLWNQTLPQTTLMPGATALLGRLQNAGLPIALASASDRNWVDRWLSRFALHPFFQTIVTGDDVSHNKPAPDVYLLAAQHLKVQPQRCLVFEDSLVGIRAAKAAGMTTIAVAGPVTRHLDFSQADGQIPDLTHVSTDRLDHLLHP